MLSKVSAKVEEYISDFFYLISFGIIVQYLEFVLYIVNYKKLLRVEHLKISGFFRFSVFALSFLLILFLIQNIITFAARFVLKRGRKLLTVFHVFLQIILFVYIYVDMGIYKSMGVHLHNNIVLQALNSNGIKNDMGLSFSKIVHLLYFPLIISLFFAFLFFLYIKFKFYNLEFVKKTILHLFNFSLMSILFLLYFWIILANELTAIPLWSYIESNHTISNFTSNYSEGFDIDKVKIKDKKMNVLILVSESLRSDMFKKEIMPNIYEFKEEHINDTISSKYHFSGAHFTINSMFSLWYSIYGYHDYAVLNFKDYKEPLPVKIFNKLGYDTSFFTCSDIDSFERIRKAEQSFDTYRKFRKDTDMLKSFKKYYNTKIKNKPFVSILFLVSTHYGYFFTDKFSKFKPYTKMKDVSDSMLKETEKDKLLLFNRYKNSVLYVDELFKQIMDMLSEEDKKNTIIIFTGDHGEQFWEHGNFGHIKDVYYKETVQVPFLFYIPGLNKKVNVKFSSHIDIMPTLLSYITNIDEKEIEKYFNGRNLLDYDEENRYFVITSFNFMGLKNHIALVNKYGKLILKFKGNSLDFNKNVEIVDFRDFDDNKISDKKIIERFLKDKERYSKEYLRFLDKNNSKKP